MSRSPEAPVNSFVLSKARINSRRTAEEAAKRALVKIDMVLSWESGEKRPTLNQLRGLASLYDVNLAALLATDANNFYREIPTPSFRRNHSHQMSGSLLREVRRAQDRRRIFLDLGEPEGHLPSITGLSAEEGANAVRKMMGITIDDQLSFSNEYKALNAWAHGIETLGVLIFQVSRIPLTDFSGLSIWEERVPIIILNGADQPKRRIFTLMHELGHLIDGNSGICDLSYESESDNKSEVWCNYFAASLLLPKDSVLEVLKKQDPIRSLKFLSNKFHVSQSAIAIRLFEIGLIDENQLSTQLALARRLASAPKPEKGKESSGGPPQELVKLRNLGEPYTSAVLDAMENGAISPLDASYFLDAKIPTVEKIQVELAKRALST